MASKYDYDYIIIGSGPAGRTAALGFAKSKKRIAIIENNKYGGAEYNTRDVPYSVCLHFAHNYNNIKNYPAISGQDLHFNFPTLVTHQSHVVNSLSNESKKALDESGVTCISGQAHFIDSHTIAVGSNKYTSANFIIATGAKDKNGEISGLEEVNHLTPDTALRISRLPKYAFVVGGGPTGCEIAEYYAELGTKVIIMERSTRLLPHEDEETSAVIKDYFENELGIMVVTGAKVVAIEQDNVSKRVIFTNGSQEKFVRIDCIVLATGSEPYLDLGLENAGVKYKNTGIVADKYFQTSTKHIYAIGDVIGCVKSSTERAEYQASLLVNNLLRRTKTPANYRGFIRHIDTYPEVASIGLNEYDLISRDRKYKKSIVYLKELSASKVNQFDYGFVKLLVDSSNRLLGATIVAPNATSLAEKLALALRHHISITEIASTPHLANSFGEAIKQAARKLIK